MLYGLDLERLEADWRAHLEELTGETILRSSTFPEVPTAEVSRDLPEPELSSPQAGTGDQIALTCDGRIWLGDIDGTGFSPLTAPGPRFDRVYWSPDGKWLVGRWLYQHEAAGRLSALYLLSPDGAVGRLVPDPRQDTSNPAFSPDGRYLVYDYQMGTQTHVLDLQTGRTRRLPARPFWSPDGQYMVYGQDSPRQILLAKGNWEDARAIADQDVLLWSDKPWSPDGKRLTLVVPGVFDISAGVYDLRSGEIAPLTNSEALTVREPPKPELVVTDSADPALLVGLRPEWAWPLGWSADGSTMLLGVRLSAPEGAGGAWWALYTVPSDESPPAPIALMRQEASIGFPTWSPADSDQLAFTWPVTDQQGTVPSAYIYDLSTGPQRVISNARRIQWSPDGAWLGVLRWARPVTTEDSLFIFDRDGTERYALAPAADCTDFAWNPAPDGRP
jgi:dipeptidyl aminopeptidase/acylaminoacyl peptidase